MKNAARTRCNIIKTFVLGWLLLPSQLIAAPGGNLAQRLGVILGNRSDVSVSVGVISGNKHTHIYSYKDTTLRKPASVMKLLTSWLVLSKLGPFDTLKTRFYLQKDGFLRVEGDGDPLMTAEVLWGVARKLKSSGISRIAGFSIDPRLDTFRPQTSSDAYGAPVSPLSLNFNSREFLVCPSGKDGIVKADPWENFPQPISQIRPGRGALHFSEKEGQTIIQGKVGKSCVRLHQSVSDPLDYFSRTLCGYLGYLAIGCDAKAPLRIIGRSTPNEKLLYTHNSAPLIDILSAMNRFSNNIIADQLIAAVGSRMVGDPFENGVSELSSALRKTFALPDGIQLRDGSGLSYDNRVTSLLMETVIGHAMTKTDFGVELLSTLPVGGRSGTLQKWSWTPTLGVVRAKTGTLKGVRSLVGVLRDSCGNQFTFSILQSPAQVSKAWNLERAILKSIATSVC